MTDAPDEIWASAENEDFSAQTLPDIRAYASPDGLVDKPTKYIRADISQAAVEALKAKLSDDEWGSGFFGQDEEEDK